MDLLLVLFLIAFFFILWSSKDFFKNLPPGPWRLPLIGHLHLLLKLPPHKALHAISQKYGPIVYLSLGMIPTIVISTQQLAKELFTANDAIFSSRPYLILGEYISYGFLGMATAPYGEHWKNTRKLCVMELFTAKCMNSFAWIRREEVSFLLRSVMKNSIVNQPMEVRRLSSICTFNMMTRIIFTKRYFGDAKDVDVDANANLFKELNKEVVDLAIKPCLANFVPWYLRWLDWRIPHYKKVHATHDKFLQSLVDEHKKTTRDCKDFLDIMLEFFGEGTHAETCAKANLVDMLVAGTDTSAVTSEWMLAALMHNPRVMQKAQEELNMVVGKSRMVAESDLPKLDYLNAVIKETFRCYPTGVFLLPRISREASQIGGYDIPKGTSVMINVWAIQRDPAVWENPNEFWPERFIGSSVDYKGLDYELIPFGAGRRRCPGLPLGARMVGYMVANLIHGFDWSFDPSSTRSMEDEFAGVCQLKTSLRATATPRLPSEAYADL